MRRADRLFQIVQFLRQRRVTTAGEVARELEVSTRTVYRDIQDLIESGIPIEGEAGVGYRLQKGFELPALTFTVDELSALVLGGRLVEAWADPELGVAVRGAMAKIESALPEPLQAAMLKTALFGPPRQVQKRADGRLSQLRKAIGDEHAVQLEYTDTQGGKTTRCIVPLGLYFWGKHWLLAAYCLLRTDYRAFRVDRVDEVSDHGVAAPLLAGIEPAVTLAAFIRHMEAKNCRTDVDVALPTSERTSR
jgi:predicted DNA-binding transcriptional regulator YafY